MGTRDKGDDLIAQAFKKLDERIRKEKADEERAERARKFKERQLEETQRQRRVNLTIYSIVFLFLFSMGLGIYKANGTAAILEKFSFISKALLASADIDCEHPKNWAEKSCKEARKLQLNNRWDNMYLNKGKERPFAIHKEKKD